MRTYLFAPLLFGLSAAAPVADDLSHSHILHKRNLLCGLSFGHGILERDCGYAVEQMRRMTPNTVHPGTGQPIPNMGFFGRINADPHYRLPQRFSVGTCTILVDSVEVGLILPSTWNLLANNAKILTDQCVHSYGIGGRFKTNNINTVIANEANMGAEIRYVWQQCINLITTRQNQDGFVHCLLERIERMGSEQADQARSRTSATQPRQARNIEDISVLQERD